MTHKWAGMNFSAFGSEPKYTGFNKKELVDIGLKSVQLP